MLKIRQSVAAEISRLLATSLPICRSVCRNAYCGKTAVWIRMPFGMVSAVGRGMGVLDVCGYMHSRRMATGCSSSLLQAILQAAVAILHVFTVLFASTPISILNLTISQESQSFKEFNDTFCVWKYCQLFTHESINDQYAISALFVYIVPKLPLSL